MKTILFSLTVPVLLSLSSLVGCAAPTSDPQWQIEPPEEQQQQVSPDAKLTVATLAELPYAEGPGWQAVMLPYDDGRQVLAVSAANREAFEAEHAGHMDEIVAAMSRYELTLSMPEIAIAGRRYSLGEQLVGHPDTGRGALEHGVRIRPEDVTQLPKASLSLNAPLFFFASHDAHETIVAVGSAARVTQ